MWALTQPHRSHDREASPTHPFPLTQALQPVLLAKGPAPWLGNLNLISLLPSLFYLPETRTSTPFPGTKTSLLDKMYSIDLYLCGLVTPVLPNEAK